MILLLLRQNPRLYKMSRPDQPALLRVRQLAPVGPIQRPQSHIVTKDDEGSAPAADGWLARFRSRRSADRPSERMLALRALPHRGLEIHFLRRAGASG